MDQSAQPIEAELLNMWSQGRCTKEKCDPKLFIAYKYKHPNGDWRVKNKIRINDKEFWQKLRTGKIKLELEAAQFYITPKANKISLRLGLPRVSPEESWIIRIKGEKHRKSSQKIGAWLFAIISIIIAFYIIKDITSLILTLFKFLRPAKEVL